MNDGTPEVLAKTDEAGPAGMSEKPLGMAWPPQIYSLSHLAVPFAKDDPLFGIEPDMNVDYGLRLGLLRRAARPTFSNSPATQFLRLNSNPFFPYVVERMTAFVPR